MAIDRKKKGRLGIDPNWRTREFASMSSARSSGSTSANIMSSPLAIEPDYLEPVWLVAATVFPRYDFCRALQFSIFDKVKLRPAQLRTVADRRFADALYLRNSNRNERANGVMYLAGFVIECLLKAQLVEKYTWLQSTRSSERLSTNDRHLWSLCYRSHDLDEILSHLPELARILIRPNRDLSVSLRSICAAWTIHARYSPYSATMSQAAKFLAEVQEIKKCLLK
jgi:hypothetical protein